jgi:hypothetical protein
MGHVRAGYEQDLRWSACPLDGSSQTFPDPSAVHELEQGQADRRYAELGIFGEQER